MGVFGDSFCSQLHWHDSEGTLLVQLSCAETREQLSLYFFLEMIWQNEGYVVFPDAHYELMRLHLCKGEENRAHVEWQQ